MGTVIPIQEGDRVSITITGPDEETETITGAFLDVELDYEGQVTAISLDVVEE